MAHLPPNTCPDCAHDPGKCIHPMDFTEINGLLRRIREQAKAPREPPPKDE